MSVGSAIVLKAGDELPTLVFNGNSWDPENPSVKLQHAYLLYKRWFVKNFTSSDEKEQEQRSHAFDALTQLYTHDTGIPIGFRDVIEESFCNVLEIEDSAIFYQCPITLSRISTKDGFAFVFGGDTSGVTETSEFALKITIYDRSALGKWLERSNKDTLTNIEYDSNPYAMDLMLHADMNGLYTALKKRHKNREFSLVAAINAVDMSSNTFSFHTNRLHPLLIDITAARLSVQEANDVSAKMFTRHISLVQDKDAYYAQMINFIIYVLINISLEYNYENKDNVEFLETFSQNNAHDNQTTTVDKWQSLLRIWDIYACINVPISNIAHLFHIVNKVPDHPWKNAVDASFPRSSVKDYTHICMYASLTHPSAGTFTSYTHTGLDSYVHVIHRCVYDTEIRAAIVWNHYSDRFGKSIGICCIQKGYYRDIGAA